MTKLCILLVGVIFVVSLGFKCCLQLFPAFFNIVSNLVSFFLVFLSHEQSYEGKSGYIVLFARVLCFSCAPVLFPLFVNNCLPLSLVGHYVIDLPVLEAFLFSYFQKPMCTISGCRSACMIVEPSLNMLIQGEFIFNM